MLQRPPDLLFVPAHVLPLICPDKCVVTIHDLGYLAFPDAHPWRDRQYLHWSTGWSARRATLVLADSSATRDDLVRHYQIDPAKIRVIHLGRDPRLAPVSDPNRVAAVRQRYDLADRYLLHVGTVQPRKNLKRLIAAFASVAGHPGLADTQLVLTGKLGWLYGDLLPEVARHGLAGRVRFTGYVADEDLAPLLSGATAFVFPSLYEGFGFPVLEAQSCGVPVMTSNNSSLPEIAGDAALFVDPLDVDEIAAAIVRLASEPDLRSELSRKGLENAQRFSWEKCATETLAALEDAAAGRA
jgi:glycosyltransferase involved in cell wall biosynthesis